MPSPIEEIKSRIDIVEFVHSYVRLQKSGVNFRGLCPFHTEKTPSFFISPSRQTWHCFGGCGEGGDVFKFVMKIEGFEFPEALRMLASRAGVVLRREDPAIRSERNRLYDLCETATMLFERARALTPRAAAYLEKRGMREETIKNFRIGFAPESWDFLIQNLGRRGFAPHEIEKAGLAIRSEEKHSWHDRFRSRIMFPITDTNSRVVGFGGRIFEPPTTNHQPPTTEAKYINTPQTLLYDKSRALYGFDKARHEIRAKNQVVVVEGYMDCVMSHQAGVANTVAVSGTALTSPQLKILRRLCNTIASSFDTDSAGDSATRRSLALAAEHEFERRIVAIPAGKDPADTVVEDPGAWARAVENARGILEFYFDKAFRDHNPAAPEGKKAITALLLPLLRDVVNEIERAHWVGELARRINIGEDAVWRELGRFSSPAPGPGFSAQSTETATTTPRTIQRRHMLEERLLILLSMASQDVRGREFQTHRVRFADAGHREIFEAFVSGGGEGALASRPGFRERIDLLRFKGEVLAAARETLDEELRLCKKELEKQSLREDLGRISDQIKESEKLGQTDETGRLLREFQETSGQLKEFG